MKISIITPNRNGARFLEASVRSVLAQRVPGLEMEYLFYDGLSTDNSVALLEPYRGQIDRVVVEADRGPASALNKGLAATTGDVIGWLNADDLLLPGALQRVADTFARHPGRALAFGRCLIVDEAGREIRRGITRFKESFFPLSSRFTFQCINYLSQPATFFRRSAWERAGGVREDLKAAFDYEFFLRLWREGGAVRVPGPPLAAFRWHAASISSQHFERQFREEFEAARADAGTWSLQTLLHLGVRWGIVGSYTWMTRHQRAGRPS